MALSNAEKMRRYRERQKEKKLQELKKPTPLSDLYRTPFFRFFEPDRQRESQYVDALELAGITPLFFQDDSGPETVTLDEVQHDDGPFFGERHGTSLGKAEILVGCLLDAATDLAGWINDYKRAEIKARIAEVEASDMSTPEARKEAFARMAELTEIQAELDRTVRWPVPVWRPEAKGQY